MSDRVEASGPAFLETVDDATALQRYRTLVNVVDDGIYQLDSSGRFVAVNDVIVDRTGYSRDELLGKHASVLFAEAEYREIEEEIATCLETGERDTETFEFGVRTADGDVIPCELRMSLLLDDGDFQGTVGIVREVEEGQRAQAIADRRELKQELREEHDLVEGILETSPVGIAVVDADGTVTFANERAEAIYGRSRQELADFDHDDPRWDLVDEDGELLAEGEAPFDRVVDRGEAIYDQVVGLRRPSGERVWVSVNGAPQWNDDGRFERAVFAFEDVTEQRERKRELSQYETMFEESKDVSIIVEPDGTFRYLTPSASKVFGYRQTELVGENGFDYIHPDDRAAAMREFAEMIETPGYEPRITFRFRHEDGSWIVLEALARDLRDDPDIEGVVVYTRDISERRARERELEESERRYRTLVENFPNGSVGLFDEELRYTAVGGELLEAVDVKPEDRIGRNICELHPEDLVEEIEPHYRAALEGETGSFEIEYRDRHLHAYTHPVRNADDEIFAGMLVVQDVTERKAHEQALQESRNQLRALIDVLPVGVFVAEADGELVEWNEAAEEIWGGEVAESDSVAEYDEYEAWWVDTGEPVEPHEWPIARALQGEEVTDPDEIKIEGFDGEYRTVLNHGMPVRDADGEVNRAVVTLVDITERKEYQRRLKDSNERLEQFAYAASHDLQEPLRMVSSYLQLIENRYGDELDDDGEEFLEFAVDGAERMKAMIEGLLEYSRIESRGDPFEPVDLDAVFEDVRQDLQVKIDEYDAEITTGDLPRVSGDGSQLNQVFQNLLSNAIEYRGDESPRVHVDAERDGDDWIVSVSDEGIGLDPADADRIFEVFQSLHAPAEHAGTGIGLALCRRIVERHGGDIWVDGEPGEGATFSFTLPAVSPSDA